MSKHISNSKRAISSERLFTSATVEMQALYRRKNADYGNSFEEVYGRMGDTYPLIHLLEKLSRIERLVTTGKEPEVRGESLRDSLLDLANYSVMWIVELDNARMERPREEDASPRLPSPDLSLFSSSELL